MKKKYFYSISIVLSLFLFGCDVTQPINGKDALNMRVAIETKYQQDSYANVFLEGADGNLITGSTVLVVNSNAVAALLNFNFQESCYRGVLPPSADGQFNIEVISSLIEGKKTQKFSHYRLVEKPNLKILRDSNGVSALDGEILGVGNNITISWSNVSYANVYQVAIQKNGIECFVISTDKLSIIINSQSMPGAGAYSCKITAQYIKGDPLFTDKNFYSYSEAPGASVYFDVE